MYKSNFDQKENQDVLADADEAVMDTEKGGGQDVDEPVELELSG